MRSLGWTIYVLWGSLATLAAHPVLPTDSKDSSDSSSFWHWELYWLKYTTGLLGITVTAFTLVGCLCCRRQRRSSKGFQEFKDGISIEDDPTLQPTMRGLELQIPSHMAPSMDRIHFEPLPVERFVPEMHVTGRPKPPPPSPSVLEEKSHIMRDPCSDWYQASDLHVPREKLKYLREIGHGWFGKVVEGRADIEDSKVSSKCRNVVVRILTEEASTKEKAWFLGEATPYFKLCHRNVLALFGSCLEADPYLLLFESCPLGDLKQFLRSNRDEKSKEALAKENMPTRIAIEIGAGLRHMHEHGFAHTDLSARNCLVASDLSIKLGDYGTCVERYPEDYYVLGDRALPIRWSAPESVECTETTIETREIIPKANLWSYGVVLWEIATWGDKPYSDLDDEQVIEMLLSSKTGLKTVGSQLLLQNCVDCPNNILEAIRSCLVLEPNERLALQEVRHVLIKDQLEANEDFEQRWETLRPNAKECVKSASLQDLRGSVDSEFWPSLMHSASFRLGPEEPVKNVPGSVVTDRRPFRESDSETEEESWRGKVERGAYTEKVRQKSKSVADLMVLVHIEPDSDAEMSLGALGLPVDKMSKKRMPATGSDGDLSSIVLEDEFDLAMKKLRDPLPAGNSLRVGYAERPKLLSLTTYENRLKSVPLAKFDAGLEEGETRFSNNFQVTDLDDSGNGERDTRNDLTLWNNALDSALERKSGFVAEVDFNEEEIESMNVPVAPSPQSRGDYSAEEEYSNGEESVKKLPFDEDDRKRMSTPDDERSSDSGFRDKESCEEEESPQPSHPTVILPVNSEASKLKQETAEEEQMRILFELDTILDAEYSGPINDSLDPNIEKTLAEEKKETDLDESETVQSTSETCETEKELTCVHVSKQTNVKSANDHDRNEDLSKCTEDVNTVTNIEHWQTTENDNDDEDSSTMSLRSDNSYVSFSMDEEFVAAIRNELKEKLPHAQMSVTETPELHDEDEPSIASDADSKNWEDEDSEEISDRGTGVDISIRYNMYGTPLSPIMEERESGGNSESQVSKDDDVSIASRGSLPDEDMLLVDTRTNRAMLLEGLGERLKSSQDGNDTLEENKLESSSRNLMLLDPKPDNLTTEVGGPLPSPEDEVKWQQLSSTFPIPLQMQDDLMSTSFASDRDWESQDEGEDEGENDDDDDDEDDDEEEENSSSSGEFVWKRYDDEQMDERGKNCSLRKKGESQLSEDILEEDVEGEDEEEEEFTPSAWDASLAPHRSALRSPEKALKSGDQKKSVWFKKQRYHCVYEYPKEAPPPETQDPTITSWEPTSYADWEEMIDNIDRLEFQPMDYFENSDKSGRSGGDEEFFVSSSNRPFQFQPGNGKFVSQFFPGASTDSSAGQDSTTPKPETPQSSGLGERQQLGELRHTRDRLTLNLTLNGGGGMRKLGKLQGKGLEDEDSDEDDDGEKTADDKKTVEDKQTVDDKTSEEKSTQDVKNAEVKITEAVTDRQETENPSTNAEVANIVSPGVKISPSDGQAKNLESKDNRDSLNLA